MKLTASKKIHYDSGPNMTPLVDVALVILIFMMLVGTFGTGEHYLRGQVPAEPASGAGSAINEPVVIRLSVAPAHGVSAAFLDQRASSIPDLQARLRQLHARLDAAAPGAGEHTLILLAPERTLPYQQAIAAFDAVAKAGFSRIAFTSAQ